MKQTTGWFLLLLVGILLVVIGFEGALGKVVAVAFTPGLLQDKGDTTAGKDF